MNLKKKQRRVVIVGAGGHAKVVADIILKCEDIIVGFLDGVNPSGDFLGYPKLGTDADYKKYLDCYFIVAIGNANVREHMVKSMDDVKWYTAIHPNAVVSSLDTVVGEGTVIMANAVVNAGTHIGKHCILNTGCVVDHDNNISDFVHISVGSKIAGTVSIGEKTWIGIGASVNNGVKICSNCMIGAGSVVVRDIKQSGTYVGVPSKKISH